MSIRIIVCLLFVFGFSWYAYRNWFVSLCASVFLMAFLKHPDMPRSVLGIPGLNVWNILMANVLIAWWHQRRAENLEWDMPRSIKIAIRLYLAVVTISCFRFLIHPTDYYTGTRIDIFMEFFLNSLRFLIPAYLFYDGCRNKQRVEMALGAIVLFYFLLSIQVVRYMGFHPDFSGKELSARAARIIQRSVGYDRVDMSMMLAGASWAAIALSNIMEKKWHKWGLRAASLVIVVGQSMTGGRTGYATWGIVGLILCTLRWRRLLPLIPLAAVMVAVLLPSVAQRMFSGFGGQQGGIVVHENNFEITSGRNQVWPVVIAKIKESPLLGYGRQGMLTTGLVAWVKDNLDDEFPHPHEAYLEMMLDNGIIGFLCIVPIYFIAVKRSGSLFLDRSDSLYEAAGGVALSLLLALLFASFGAQTLYPREGVVGMWAAIGVALRVSEDRKHKRGEDNSYTFEYAGRADESEEPNFVESARVAVCEA